MRNALQIVTDALDELGIPTPSSITSTTDDTEKQCRAILHAGARSFRNLRTFPQLKKKHEITLVSARYQYPLPSDYYAALPDTAWDEDRAWRLMGPLSDGEMTSRVLGLTGGSTNRIGYRVFGPDINPASTGGQFKVEPTPTASGGVLSFEYIIRSMFVKSDYTTYYELLNADTDYCLFDDDLMTAEFKWRYLRAKKKDYEQELADAKTLLDAAVARWQGTFIGSLTGGGTQRRYSVPDGGWSF